MLAWPDPRHNSMLAWPDPRHKAPRHKADTNVPGVLLIWTAMMTLMNGISGFSVRTSAEQIVNKKGCVAGGTLAGDEIIVLYEDVLNVASCDDLS